MQHTDKFFAGLLSDYCNFRRPWKNSHRGKSGDQKNSPKIPNIKHQFYPLECCFIELVPRFKWFTQSKPFIDSIIVPTSGGLEQGWTNEAVLSAHWHWPWSPVMVELILAKNITNPTIYRTCVSIRERVWSLVRIRRKHLRTFCIRPCTTFLTNKFWKASELGIFGVTSYVF